MKLLLYMVIHCSSVHGNKLNTFLYSQTMKSYPTIKRRSSLGFPGGAVVESLPANAGDTGSSPGLGRSHMPRSN